IETIDPLSRGSLVHEVLYTFLSELRDAGQFPIADAGAARARLGALVDAVAERFRDDLAPLIDRVWDDGVAAIRADVAAWLDRVLDEREWTPWRFELAFGIPARDPDSRADAVPLDCGIHLRGAIDLVERDATGAVRATDYKTGRFRASHGAVIAGGDVLQPVLYALA